MLKPAPPVELVVDFDLFGLEVFALKIVMLISVEFVRHPNSKERAKGDDHKG